MGNWDWAGPEFRRWAPTITSSTNTNSHFLSGGSFGEMKIAVDPSVAHNQIAVWNGIDSVRPVGKSGPLEILNRRVEEVCAKSGLR